MRLRPTVSWLAHLSSVPFLSCTMYRVSIFLLSHYLSFTIFAAPTRSGHPDSPIVKDDTSNISYHGIAKDGIESFLNIKFGSDTGGENRFARPRAYTYERHSIIDVSAPGPACPQQKVPIPGLKLFSNVTELSEDCLNLRVDRPAGTKSDAGLPVMLWIYGGGDTIGQVYDSAYDPTGLVLGSVQQNRPVIYVAMIYRLGFFGWSAFEENNSTAIANVGLHDQRLAMEWVQKNIAHFGGDPNKVTIFGESDGAVPIGLQITAFGGGQPAPFQRAIMASGSAAVDMGTSSGRSLDNTHALIDVLKCGNDHNDTARSIDCLRKLTLEEILPTEIDYTLKAGHFSGFDAFIPTVDETFVPAAPSNLLRSGKFAKDVSVIIGWNEDDSSLFTASPNALTNDTALEEYLIKTLNLTDDQLREALALYPTNEPSIAANIARYPRVPPQWTIASRMLRDSGRTCPGILMAQAISNRPNASTYLYNLNSMLYAPFLAAGNASFEGVIHSSDIPYVFNQARALNASEDQLRLSSQISGSWVEFAHSGNPVSATGDSTIFNWPQAFSNHGDNDQGGLAIEVIGGSAPGVVNAGVDLATVEDFQELGRRCAFWNRPDLLAAFGV